MLPAGTLNVHSHHLPPPYLEALRSAGVHLLDGGVPVPEWTAQGTIELMDQLGIAGAVLSVSSPFAASIAGADVARLCRDINDHSASLRDRYPDRFGAYAMLPVPLVDESLDELVRALDDLELDGVALPSNAAGVYLGDTRLSKLLDALDERAATVFVHPTSPCCFETFGLGLPAPMIEYPFDTTRTIVSLLYSQGLERRARIKFVFAHGGGTVPFLAPRFMRIGSSSMIGERARSAEEAMAWLRRWYYDLALIGRPEQVAMLKSLVPSSQIVYGTDHPFSPTASILAAAAAFETLPFDADERKAVAYRNAAPLFPRFARKCGCDGL